MGLVPFTHSVSCITSLGRSGIDESNHNDTHEGIVSHVSEHGHCRATKLEQVSFIFNLNPSLSSSLSVPKQVHCCTREFQASLLSHTVVQYGLHSRGCDASSPQWFPSWKLQRCLLAERYTPPIQAASLCIYPDVRQDIQHWRKHHSTRGIDRHCSIRIPRIHEYSDKGPALWHRGSLHLGHPPAYEACDDARYQSAH